LVRIPDLSRPWRKVRKVPIGDVAHPFRKRLEPV